jgi:hypothetical protein
VAGLSSVDPAFPLHLWERLLLQAEITLNLLRTSRLHPQLSAAAHFHGLMDYNKTAFAPPGCKIVAHEKPGKRRTRAPHEQHGYSLGPAMHHYGCQNFYISATASKRIVDRPDFSLTIISCNSCLTLTDCSWRPTTCNMRYKTLIRRYHSLTSGMTPSQRSQHWGDFQTQIPESSHSQTSSSPCQGHSAHIPRRIIQSNLRFSHAPAAPDEITDKNSRSKHSQRAFTSEGGHTNEESAFTSEVTMRLLRHGHCPHVHRHGKSPLVPAAPIQCILPPHHRKRNGIHGRLEIPPSATTLETSFWQRSRTPFSRHSGHSWNRHMFLRQTYKHSKRQTIHLKAK